MNRSELNTVLAALRLYQAKGYGDPSIRPLWLHEIACPDDCVSLDSEAIDTLCEKLNCEFVCEEDESEDKQEENEGGGVPNQDDDHDNQCSHCGQWFEDDDYVRYYDKCQGCCQMDPG